VRGDARATGGRGVTVRRARGGQRSNGLKVRLATGAFDGETTWLDGDGDALRDPCRA